MKTKHILIVGPAAVGKTGIAQEIAEQCCDTLVVDNLRLEGGSLHTTHTKEGIKQWAKDVGAEPVLVIYIGESDDLAAAVEKYYGVKIDLGLRIKLNEVDQSAADIQQERAEFARRVLQVLSLPAGLPLVPLLS